MVSKTYQERIRIRRRPQREQRARLIRETERTESREKRKVFVSSKMSRFMGSGTDSGVIWTVVVIQVLNLILF